MEIHKSLSLRTKLSLASLAQAGRDKLESSAHPEKMGWPRCSLLLKQGHQEKRSLLQPVPLLSHHWEDLVSLGSEPVLAPWF